MESLPLAGVRLEAWWGLELTEDGHHDDGCQAQHCCDDQDPHFLKVSNGVRDLRKG